MSTQIKAQFINPNPRNSNGSAVGIILAGRKSVKQGTNRHSRCPAIGPREISVSVSIQALK